MSTMPPVVSATEWQQALDELLVEEKAATRELDRLAAKRRRLPMTRMGDYTFEGPDGPRTLRDLFGDQPQLVLYQFMDAGPDHLCPGCTAFTLNVPDQGREALSRFGIAWATVSDMPLDQIVAAKRDKDWSLPFYSSRGTTFTQDLGIGGGFQLVAFVRDGDDVYKTYSTGSRGVDRLLFTNSIRDVTVYGRQEDWEDSPAGWPQHPTYG